MYASVRQERTCSRRMRMRERAKVIKRFFEWLWQCQEFPGGKEQTPHSVSKVQVKGSKKLISGQLFFSPWEKSWSKSSWKPFPCMWRTRRRQWPFNMIYWLRVVLGQLLWLLWWADGLYRQARAADVIYFSKIFYMVSCSVFIHRLERCGLDGWTTRLMQKVEIVFAQRRHPTVSWTVTWKETSKRLQKWTFWLDLRCNSSPWASHATAAGSFLEMFKLD